MSVYDREWYKKEHEHRQHWQEGADARWGEVEPSRRENKTHASRNSRVSSKPKEKLIPSCCHHCDNMIQLRVSNAHLNAYSYICPSCKRKISVRTTTRTDKVITTILYILGIPAVVILFFSAINTLTKMFLF